jgi:hypothetical protein
LRAPSTTAFSLFDYKKAPGKLKNRQTGRQKMHEKKRNEKLTRAAIAEKPVRK